MDPVSLLLRLGGLFFVVESSNSITWYYRGGEGFGRNRLSMGVRAVRFLIGAAMVVAS